MDCLGAVKLPALGGGLPQPGSPAAVAQVGDRGVGRDAEQPRAKLAFAAAHKRVVARRHFQKDRRSHILGGRLIRHAASAIAGNQGIVAIKELAQRGRIGLGTHHQFVVGHGRGPTGICRVFPHTLYQCAKGRSVTKIILGTRPGRLVHRRGRPVGSGPDKNENGCRRPLTDGTRFVRKVSCSRASHPTIHYEQPMLLPQLWHK